MTLPGLSYFGFLSGCLLFLAAAIGVTGYGLVSSEDCCGFCADELACGGTPPPDCNAGKTIFISVLVHFLKGGILVEIKPKN